jgi:hypothetical protein
MAARQEWRPVILETNPFLDMLRRWRRKVSALLLAAVQGMQIEVKAETELN